MNITKHKNNSIGISRKTFIGTQLFLHTLSINDLRELTEYYNSAIEGGIEPIGKKIVFTNGSMLIEEVCFLTIRHLYMNGDHIDPHIMNLKRTIQNSDIFKNIIGNMSSFSYYDIALLLPHYLIYREEKEKEYLERKHIDENPIRVDNILSQGGVQENQTLKYCVDPGFMEQLGIMEINTIDKKRKAYDLTHCINSISSTNTISILHSCISSMDDDSHMKSYSINSSTIQELYSKIFEKMGVRYTTGNNMKTLDDYSLYAESYRGKQEFSQIGITYHESFDEKKYVTLNIDEYTINNASIKIANIAVAILCQTLGYLICDKIPEKIFEDGKMKNENKLKACIWILEAFYKRMGYDIAHIN